MFYHETNDQHAIYDPDARHIIVETRVGEKWITVLDFQSKNESVLSENFRDCYGYSDAVEALTSWNIPHESPMWKLGHKGGDTHWKLG